MVGLVIDAILPQYQAAVLDSIFNGTGLPVVMRPSAIRDANGWTVSYDGSLVPSIWDGRPELVGSRSKAVEHANAILIGQLGAAYNMIGDLEYESGYHEMRRDELYAELHPDMSAMDFACDLNSVGGGGYSVATAGTKSNRISPSRPVCSTSTA